MSSFAVIDTETNWKDEVMSIGIVISDDSDMKVIDAMYFILTPEIEIGGLYEDRLSFLDGITCTRRQALRQIESFLRDRNVSRIFAYNALFDFQHLPELSAFDWHDIIRIAAYKQFNPHIPDHMESWTTGRLKRGYGVENMMRMLTGDSSYYEIHNALSDAIDELRIMKHLGYKVSAYPPLD